jgi:hypothetical protein
MTALVADRAEVCGMAGSNRNLPQELHVRSLAERVKSYLE